MSNTGLATVLKFYVLSCKPNTKGGRESSCFDNLIPVRVNQSSRLDNRRFRILTKRLICFITCLYITDVSSGPSISSPGLDNFVDLKVVFV